MSTLSRTFKFIKTDRLIIRPLQLIDAEVYYQSELASFEEMAPNWSWVDKDKSLTVIQNFLEQVQQLHEKDYPSAMYFGVFTKQDDKFCGCIWYSAISWFVPRFEIGYWQDSRKCGYGYMTEAVNALTQVSFLLYQANRVEIRTFGSNQKSRSIPERLGFQFEAVLKHYFVDFVSHHLVDAAIYACINLKQLPELKFIYK